MVGVPRRQLVGRRVPQRDTSPPSRRRLLDIPMRADTCADGPSRSERPRHRRRGRQRTELDHVPAACGLHVLRRDLPRRHPHHRAAVALRARRPRRVRPRRDTDARRLARDGDVPGGGHRRRLGALRNRWRGHAERVRRRRDGARRHRDRRRATLARRARSAPLQRDREPAGRRRRRRRGRPFASVAASSPSIPTVDSCSTASRTRCVGCPATRTGRGSATRSPPT